jgi:microcystin degradation protein MlrC
MRIAIGMFMQETHSFSPLPTGLAEFRESPVVPLSVGDKLLEAHRGIDSGLGGFIKVCDEVGVELVPLIATSASTSGPVTRAAYEWLKSLMLEKLTGSLPVDGVLLALHGAMTTESVDDPEGDILASIKTAVGERTMIGCSLDLHAVLTQKMVNHADILVSYETHVDYSITSERAARLLLQCMRDGIKPYHYLEKPPMIMGDHGQLLEEKRGIEKADPDILTISLLDCNPWTDVVDYGPAVLVTCTGPHDRLARISIDLARRFWETRHGSVSRRISIDSAISRILTNTGGPVMLEEAGDLVGGGGTGDDVTLLSGLIAAGVDDLTAVIYDPVAVEAAFDAGLNTEATLSIGGKYTADGPSPLRFDCRVVRLFDGEFVHVGVPYGGLRAPLGRTAAVADGDIHIVLTSKRVRSQGSAIFAALDLDYSTKRAIVGKGCTLNCMSFPVSAHYSVDTPGITEWDFRKVPYHNVPRPRYPLDDVADPFTHST